MHVKFAIKALLVSNLANAAVVPREFDGSFVAAIEKSAPVLGARQAASSPASGLPVVGPQPHVKAPGTGSGKTTGQRKGSKSNKKLRQGFIGGGNPGHAQKPASPSGKAKKSKSGRAGVGQPKKAKSGSVKSKTQGGKASVPGGPEPGNQPISGTSAATSATPAPGSGSLSSTNLFTGDLTYYTPGLGSCGVTNSESDMIVALAEDMMTGSADPNTNRNCGKSITITYKGVSASATIEDTCPGCSGAGLDLTPALFQKFAPLGEGRLTEATWHFN